MDLNWLLAEAHKMVENLCVSEVSAFNGALEANTIRFIFSGGGGRQEN